MSLDINNYKKTKNVALGSQWSIGDKKWFKWLGDFIEDIKAYVATYVADNAGGSSYSVYTALLTQTSTNAPVATVLENTLGITPTWVRDMTGAYYVQDNIFTTPKTVCVIGSPSARQHIYTMIVDSNQVYITTFYNGTDTDGLLSNTSIEIRVYP